MEVDSSSGKEETFPDADLINISLGFQMRTWYKKKVKTSRLDGLLERRVKQFTLEEKQRLERFKLGSASKQTTGSNPQPSLHEGTKLRSETNELGIACKSVSRKLKMDLAGGCRVEAAIPCTDETSGSQVQAPSKSTPSAQEASGMPSTSHSGSLLTEAFRKVGDKQDSDQSVDVLTKTRETKEDSQSRADKLPENRSSNADAAGPSSTCVGQEDDQGCLANSPLVPCKNTQVKDCLNSVNNKPVVPGGVRNSTVVREKDSCSNLDSATHSELASENCPTAGSSDQEGSCDSNMDGASRSSNGEQGKEERTNVAQKDSDCSEVKCNNVHSQEGKVQVNGQDSIHNVGDDRPGHRELLTKPFMNGDVSMEDKNGVSAPLSPSQTEDLGKVKVSPSSEKHAGFGHKKVKKLDDMSSEPLLNPVSGVEEMVTCKAQRASSPAVSGEESSLSNDSAEQNGLPGDLINGESKIRTVVTEVTTTTSTVSTSKTVVAVGAGGSSQQTTTVVSSTENKMKSSSTTTTVTKVVSPSSSGDVVSVLEHSKTVVTTTVADSLTTDYGKHLSSMTVSKEYTTKDRVRLMKFTKAKKSRSGTALPSYRKFVTKSNKKSIFVLPLDDLKKICRKGGIREVPAFSYNAKPAHDIWPYPSPRPTFGITWRYVRRSCIHYRT